MEPTVLIAALIQAGTNIAGEYIRTRQVNVPLKPIDDSQWKLTTLLQDEPKLPLSQPSSNNPPIKSEVGVIEVKSAATVNSNEPTTEKATGVKAGCIPCVPSGTLVWTDKGARVINDIVVGENIIDADGKLAQVVRVMNRPYNGDLISVTLPGQNKPVQWTPEHPVLAIKGTSCQKKHRNSNTLCFPKEHLECSNCDRRYSLEWTNAGDLTSIGKRNLFSKHILLMPQISEEKDVPPLDVYSIANIKSNARNKIKENVPVNRDFLRLLGYYLAEGSVTFQKRGALIRFDFDSKEENLAKDVQELLSTLFGLKSSITRTSNTCRVNASSVILGNFLNNLVGTGSHRKHLPFWLICLPKDKLASLLKGYWLGDGSFNISYNREVASASTVSDDLAYGLRLILNKVGIVHSLS